MHACHESKFTFIFSRPVEFNPSRHHFNSDSSQMTIQSVVRKNFEEYVCTATNKIAESSAAIMLQVFGWFDCVSFRKQLCFSQISDQKNTFCLFLSVRVQLQAVCEWWIMCWWLMRWCPLMVDCIPAWPSVLLEMHQEMSPYTVRRCLCHIWLNGESAFILYL